MEKLRKVNVGETKGMIRKIDELGRIVIPMEFRKTLGIKTNDPVEIFMVKDGLFLKKAGDN